MTTNLDKSFGWHRAWAYNNKRLTNKFHFIDRYVALCGLSRIFIYLDIEETEWKPMERDCCKKCLRIRTK